MAIDYLTRLSGARRDTKANLQLGCVLALVAGAVNAGGFLAIGGYTSHMTGIVSGMADDLALGNITLALAAWGAWLAFVSGAAVTAIMVNWGRRRRLHSQFAMSLLLEALLLLLFGLTGNYLAAMPNVLGPVTILLLCFVMGLQNAIITKISGAAIRTTHVTGLSTDMGIEVGKMLYYNRRPLGARSVRVNRAKLVTHSLLISCFFTGGVTGALAFKHIGFPAATIILACVLTLLAGMPVLHDVRLLWRFYRRRLATKKNA
ncbi:YoaK family protein [Janthinobacterium psychrotolerans]|uniref:Putative membrane protein YoaK, UPF0700 family n=1 Tax=Janthinobacterium psychrotolerans TaxID=1747903 RepID=A0A1A7C4L5_9BURK|nr:YoaK family protein [Janthinobacterium psychrotolerans]OBV39994.1 putative membrane protein YoaK, UPF0700 family [Janthinobacterium psychrotolerans]